MTGALHGQKLEYSHVVEDREAPTSPAAGPSAWQRHATNGWLWECICGFVALGALAAIIVVLVTAQGRSAIMWREQRHVSINAVLAIFSTVLKGCCMFIVTQGIMSPSCSWIKLKVYSYWPDKMAVV